MEGLLVAFGAHLLTAREAYQLSFRLQAVQWTLQLGRAVQHLSITDLADANPRRSELHEKPIKKGAARREQRDEEHPFHDYDTHRSVSSSARLARQRLFNRTTADEKGFACTMHHGGTVTPHAIASLRPAAPRRTRNTNGHPTLAAHSS
jgi:hypothetical protein